MARNKLNRGISVIIPAYNAEATMGSCITSLLNQSYKILNLSLLMMAVKIILSISRNNFITKKLCWKTWISSNLENIFTITQTMKCSLNIYVL